MLARSASSGCRNTLNYSDVNQFRHRAFSARQPRLRVQLNSQARQVLPIFPLQMVALPTATIPLMIFEARYRVLFNTLLAGQAGVEEGLVQQESPFCGTKKFGMCYVDKDGRVASIGTLLEIVDFSHVQDGRIFVTSKGKERFKVTNIVKEKPVLVCEVESLPEHHPDTEEARLLAKEVAELLRSTIRMNVKMKEIKAGEGELDTDELSALGPRELSYFVASCFTDIKALQQHLLDEDDTVKRLQKEKEVLEETIKYYSAASALKGLFSGTDASSGG